MILESLDVEIGGKKFKMAPISIGDLRAFGTHLTNERFERTKKISDFLPESERVGFIKEALKPIASDDAQSNLSSVDGIVFMAWRSIRKNHPDITLEQFKDMVTIPDMALLSTYVTRMAFGEQQENPQMPVPESR